LVADKESAEGGFCGAEPQGHSGESGEHTAPKPARKEERGHMTNLVWLCPVVMTEVDEGPASDAFGASTIVHLSASQNPPLTPQQLVARDLPSHRLFLHI